MTNKEDFINAGFEVIDSNEKPNQLLQFLKKHYPQTIKDGELKINELKNALEIPIDEKNNGYGLNFIGRNYAKAKYTQKTTKELKINQNLSKNFDETQNAIIKGDNLDSLKILLNSYRGKIKCIYIDPPYNTKNEGFIYPDKFDREEVEALGFENISEDDYRRMEFSFTNKSSHNGWLSFMYPRLKLARDLLADDGVIFVSIDDNEQANLRILMDEIFGEEEFVASFIRQTRKGGGSMSKYISIDHDYIICFTKNKDLLGSLYEEYDDEYLKRYKEEDKNGKFFWDTYARNRQGTANIYTIVAPDGKQITKGWINPESKFKHLLEIGEIRFKKNNSEWSIQVKQRINKDGQLFRSLINNYTNEFGTKNIKELFEENEIFSYAKPVALIKKLLQISTSSSDLILDFFAGSGTTAQAVMELNKEDGGNRKFILCQIDEPIDEKKKKEAFDFCLKNNLPPAISSITVERVRRAGEKILQEIEQENSKKQPDLLNLENSKNSKPHLDIGFKCFDLIETSKIIENNNQLTLQLSENDSLSKIYHLMLKVGVDDLNSKIETIIDDCFYVVNNNYYVINAEELMGKNKRPILIEALASNKNFFIDAFTASVNLTLQQYQNKNRFKIVY